VKAKRNQLFMTTGLVALGLLVGVAGLLIAVLPQRSQVSKLNTEIAAAQTRLASLELGHNRGPVIRAAQLFQLARAMPNSTDMPGVVIDLSRAAAQSGVTILSIAPATAAIQPDGSSGTPIKLTVVGSWKGVDAFLRSLRENVLVHGQKLSVSGRLFVVDQVSLAASVAGGQTSTNPNGAAAPPSGEITANLQVNAFSYGTAPLPVTTGTGTTSTTTTTTTTGSPGTAAAAGSTP